MTDTTHEFHDDLVKRLREDQPVTQDMASTMQCELQNEAADRIEELEAKLEMFEAMSMQDFSNYLTRKYMATLAAIKEKTE